MFAASVVDRGEVADVHTAAVFGRSTVMELHLERDADHEQLVVSDFVSCGAVQGFPVATKPAVALAEVVAYKTVRPEITVGLTGVH